VAATDLGTQLTQLHYTQQTALRAKTLQDVLKLWPSLDLSSIDAVTGTWPPFEQAAKTLVDVRYGNSSGLAARYYDLFRAAEGIDGTATALLADPLPEEQVVTSLRVTGLYGARHAMAQQLPQVEQNTLVRVLGAIGNMVAHGGRNTLERSVDADKKALGYARVTSGRACSFCSMLASRGPVYKTTVQGLGPSLPGLRTKEGKKYHDHCSCTSEPVFSTDQPWPGNARQLRDLYDEVTAGAENSAEARRLFRQAVEGR
jgi:hypothetical protein